MSRPESELKEGLAFRSRYLDSELKEVVLQSLRKLYVSAKNDDSNDGLDISLIPFLKELNAIEGIVTIQSCVGHTYKSKDGETYYNSSDFWIWPSKEMGKEFYEKSFKLSEVRGIEKVSTYYTSWGQEIITLSFTGLTKKRCDGGTCQGSNHEIVKEKILSFFKKLEKEIKEEI